MLVTQKKQKNKMDNLSIFDSDKTKKMINRFFCFLKHKKFKKKTSFSCNSKKEKRGGKSGPPPYVTQNKTLAKQKSDGQSLLVTRKIKIKNGKYFLL